MGLSRTRSDWHYDSQVARFAARRGPIADRRELYMHFGHWEQAPSPGHDLVDFLAAQDRLDEQLRALVDLRPRARVLDVGCGLGGTLAAVLESSAPTRAVGLNIDPRQIAIARELVRPGPDCTPEWVVGSACAIPFEADAFDVVFAVECVPHFESRAEFFAEAARVLAAAGRLVISDFVPTPELRSLRDRGQLPRGFAEIVARDLVPWLDFYGDEQDDLACARAAGFELERQLDATRQTLPTYELLVPDQTRDLAAGVDAIADGARGMAALEWAQSRGLLRMMYYAFARARGR